MDAYDVVMCGKIDGDKDFVEKFARSYAQIRQSVLKRTGRLPKVWNPALLSLECPDREYAWYLQKCYDAIFASQKATVVLLEDWAESKGGKGGARDGNGAEDGRGGSGGDSGEWGEVLKFESSKVRELGSSGVREF